MMMTEPRMGSLKETHISPPSLRRPATGGSFRVRGGFAAPAAPARRRPRRGAPRDGSPSLPHPEAPGPRPRRPCPNRPGAGGPGRAGIGRPTAREVAAQAGDGVGAAVAAGRDAGEGGEEAVVVDRGVD